MKSGLFYLLILFSFPLLFLFAEEKDKKNPHFVKKPPEEKEIQRTKMDKCIKQCLQWKRAQGYMGEKADMECLYECKKVSDF
ncbi:MAG: hypothetical protein H7A25_15065 [Leptospiraceae bacterium]|nr:hypothetical protein [Leptospiraceae bacterium]MCP5501222.1 hypothetical protein [Leptospiraceae bacterium]